MNLILWNVPIAPPVLPWYNAAQCALGGMKIVSREVCPTTAAVFQQEEAIFSHIRGMELLRQAPPEKSAALRAQYPDAAFALMTADNLFTGDSEQCAIHQTAYFSILKGENIKNIRFRYEKEMDAYVQRHMWDD